MDNTNRWHYLVQMNNTNTSEASALKVVRRFDYLNNMIAKYAHRWGESDRLYRWVDEYNNLRHIHREIFRKYCEERGYCPTHTGHDALA